MQRGLIDTWASRLLKKTSRLIDTWKHTLWPHWSGDSLTNNSCKCWYKNEFSCLRATANAQISLCHNIQNNMRPDWWIWPKTHNHCLVGWPSMLNGCAVGVVDDMLYAEKGGLNSVWFITGTRLFICIDNSPQRSFYSKQKNNPLDRSSGSRFL